MLVGPWILVSKRHATAGAPTPAPRVKPLPKPINNILQVRNSSIGGICCRVLGWIWDRSLRGNPPKCPGPMVVVTGAPPLLLLFTILMVLLVLGRPVRELAPEVNVLEESPLITVMEN